MAIVTRANVAIPNNNEGARIMYEMIDFLRTELADQWSVHSSNNGTTAGAGDNWASYTDADNSASWIVMEHIDGRQVLWRRVNTNDLVWDTFYSASGAFSGGTTSTTPTAADSALMAGGFNNTFTTGNQNWNFVGDDESSFFVAFGWQAGVPGTRTGGFACVPTTGGDPNDTDPVVWFLNMNTSSFLAATHSNVADLSSNFAGKCACYFPGTSAGTQSVACVRMYDSAAQRIPGYVPVDTDGQDVLIPALFLRPSSSGAPRGFKGFSSFVRYNAASRSTGDVLDGTNWVVVGDFVFPWENASAPTP